MSDTKLYRIAWEATPGGKRGHGEGAYLKDEAQRYADAANAAARPLLIRHWIEPATSPAANSGIERDHI